MKASGGEILIDFLNHGVMPFVGSSDLLGSLVELWRGSGSGEGIRSILVEGEAGSGKSRLVEELRRAVEESGEVPGVMLHVRILGGHSSGPLALLERGLRAVGITEPPAPDQDQEGWLSAIDRLRKLSRLRRTLLVLEDLHLVDPTRLAELATCIDFLADEPLALLCLARPGEEPIAGLLARGRLDRWRLEPWTPAETSRLWRLLFEEEGRPEVIEILHRTTRGLPLAVRAVLRDWTGEDERGILRGDRFGLSELQRRGEGVVRQIGRGLLASLLREEREMAGKRAWLGEIFTQEGGVQIVSPADIDRLRFRGIIHGTYLSIPTLPGLQTDPVDYPESDYPLLTFSHSLLWEELRTTTPAPIEELCGILAGGTPLTTSHPVAPILASLATGEKRDAIDVAPVLFRISNILHDLVLSTRWRESEGMVELLGRAIDQAAPMLDSMERRRLQISWWYKESIIAEARGEEDRHLAAVRRGSELACEVEAEELVGYRLAALVKNPDASWSDPTFLRDVFAEGESLVERYPSSRSSGDYALFLCVVAMFAHQNNQRDLFDEVEALYGRLVESIKGQSGRTRLQTWFLPIAIQVYDTTAELNRRIRSWRTIGSLPRVDALAAHVLDHEITFLYDIGRAGELIARVDRAVEIFHLRNLQTLALRARSRRLTMAGSLGWSSDQLREQASKDIASRPGDEEWEGGITRALLLSLWLAGDDAGEGESAAGSQLPDGEILRTDEIIATLLSLETIEGPEAESARSAIDRIWVRIEERQHVGWVDRLTRIAGKILPAKEARALGKKGTRLRRELATERGAKISLQVIDRFGVDDGTGPFRPITGGRMRGVLSLMVIGEIVGRPMSLEEFARRTVGGAGDDPEGARNNLYVRLHELRKLLGPEGIVTVAGEAPRLNPELVRVDLLEAIGDLDKGERSAAGGYLLDAVEQVGRGLETIGQGVPFPNLYEPIVEAAREQVEVLLRDALLRVGKLALDSGGAERAVALLRPAVTRTPEDDELREILVDALDRSAQPVEAEWWRGKGD